MFGSAFGGLYYDFNDPPKDLIVEMSLSLNEIYLGGIKQLKYSKTIVNFDGRSTEEKEFIKDIEIIKGCLNGNKSTFIGERNQKPGYTNCK